MNSLFIVSLRNVNSLSWISISFTLPQYCKHRPLSTSVSYARWTSFQTISSGFLDRDQNLYWKQSSCYPGFMGGDTFSSSSVIFIYVSDEAWSSFWKIHRKKKKNFTLSLRQLFPQITMNSTLWKNLCLRRMPDCVCSILNLLQDQKWIYSII